jgi:hypothetical protein
VRLDVLDDDEGGNEALLPRCATNELMNMYNLESIFPGPVGSFQ